MNCFLDMINSLDKGTQDNRHSTWKASGGTKRRCAGKGVAACLAGFGLKS